MSLTLEGSARVRVRVRTALSKATRFLSARDNTEMNGGEWPAVEYS